MNNNNNDSRYDTAGVRLVRAEEVELCIVNCAVSLLSDELNSLAAGHPPKAHECECDEYACAAQPSDAVEGDALCAFCDLALDGRLSRVHRLDDLEPLLDDLLARVLSVRKPKVLLKKRK